MHSTRIIGAVSHLVSLTISPPTWLLLETHWTDESCFGSSSRPRLEACRLREQGGVGGAARELVREVRVEEEEQMFIRKGDARGRSHSKLGKRGVWIDEEELSFAVGAARGGQGLVRNRSL